MEPAATSGGTGQGNQSIRDRCSILLLYHTGLRAGELASLRTGDLTIGERSGQLLVRRGKGNKARRVPLNAEAREAVRDYLLVRPTSEMPQLFVGQRGDPFSAHAVYDGVKYARLGGLDGASPHTLRHTFARALLEAGTPLTDVADLLGHQSLDTTRLYTKASETVLAQMGSRPACDPGEGLHRRYLPESFNPRWEGRK